MLVPAAVIVILLSVSWQSAVTGAATSHVEWHSGCSYTCADEPCKNCTPGTECDVAPYERCEMDAVLATANCSKTEILLEYYLRWKLQPDEHPDQYRVVFPLECTELDFCDNITHTWQQQLKLHIGLRAPQKATGEWVVVASVGRKDAKAVDRLGDLGFNKQILLEDLPTGTLYADFPSASLLMTKWDWEQKWDAAFLGHRAPFDFCFLIQVKDAQVRDRLYIGTAVASCFAYDTLLRQMDHCFDQYILEQAMATRKKLEEERALYYAIWDTAA